MSESKNPRECRAELRLVQSYLMNVLQSIEWEIVAGPSQPGGMQPTNSKMAMAQWYLGDNGYVDHRGNPTVSGRELMELTQPPHDWGAVSYQGMMQLTLGKSKAAKP